MRTLYNPRALILMAVFLPLVTINAHGALKFPEKPVTLVVGSGPGSGVDTMCRLIAATFGKYKLLPQPIIVENKPGGASAVAMAYVSGKKNDPYYLQGITTLILFTGLQGNSPVTYKDFTPICGLSHDEVMVTVQFNSRFKSMKELVDWAKANPEKVTAGGPHLGGPDSVNIYRLEKAAGIKLKYVSFGGGGDAVAALLGGHIDLTLSNPIEVLELLKANKARVLGALTEHRLPGEVSHIPTLQEQGINASGVGITRGIIAPGGIPEDARKVLEEAFFKFAKTEEYKKFHKDNILTEGWMNSSAFGRFLDDKNDSVAAILKEMGLLKK